MNSAKRLDKKLFEKFKVRIDDSTVWLELHGSCFTENKKINVSVTSKDERIRDKERLFHLPS